MWNGIARGVAEENIGWVFSVQINICVQHFIRVTIYILKKNLTLGKLFRKTKIGTKKSIKYKYLQLSIYWYLKKIYEKQHFIPLIPTKMEMKFDWTIFICG